MRAMLRGQHTALFTVFAIVATLARAQAQDPPAPAPVLPPAPVAPYPQIFVLPTLPPLLSPPPAPPSHRLGPQLLRLDPQRIDPNRRDEVLVGQPLGLTPGFLNLHIPDEITPATVGLELGIFAGKLMLLQSLCGLGRCRVQTGPGDLPMGWVEEFTQPGSIDHSPAPRLRSGR